MFGEKLYLSPILDLCSSDLVSYTISDRPALSMVTTMLDEAFAKIPAETNLILHSDQGWQYQHKQYQQMLGEFRSMEVFASKYCLTFWGHEPVIHAVLDLATT